MIKKIKILYMQMFVVYYTAFSVIYQLYLSRSRSTVVLVYLYI